MILIVILLVISMSKIVKATTITLNETNGGNVGDSYVDGTSTTLDTNYGTDVTLRTQSRTTNRNKRMLVMWNLSGIPEGSTITVATMTIYENSITSGTWGTRYLEAYNISNNWTEANITWNSLIWNNITQAGLPIPSPSVLQDNVTNNSFSYVNWNITNAVIYQYSQTNKNLSIIIKDFKENQTSTSYLLVFSSKESATVGERPKLVITYTAAAAGTQYNLTGNESMALTFGASRQLIARRNGAETMTFLSGASSTNTTGDSIKPQYSLNSTNSTLAGTPVKHNLNWSDNVGLSGYIFQFCNGTYKTSMNLTYEDDMGDAIADRADPNVNFPNLLELGEATSNITWGNALIKFDTSKLSGKTIIDASLCLYGWATEGIFIGNVSVYNSTNSTWEETNVTWNDQPQADKQENITIFINTTSPYTPIWYCFGNLKNSMNTAILNSKNVTFIMNSSSEGNDYVGFRDRNYSDATLRPFLNVTFGNSCDNWINDSWVSMNGATNWSNVTKVVNSTIGSNIAWCIYANDTSNNWNGTSCQDPFSYVTTSAGNMSNLTGSLSLSFTSNDYRKLNASRTDSLSMSLTPTRYRIANLKRNATLTMTLTESAIKSMVSIYQRIASLSMILSTSANRMGILNRLDSLTISFAENTYKNTLKIYSRLASLSMTLTSNTYRKAILNRARTLLITFISGRSVWTPPVEVEPFYQVCAAKFQFGDTPIFLCVFGDGTWKLFITGAEIP